MDRRRHFRGCGIGPRGRRTGAAAGDQAARLARGDCEISITAGHARPARMDVLLCIGQADQAALAEPDLAPRLHLPPVKHTRAAPPPPPPRLAPPALALLPQP